MGVLTCLGVTVTAMQMMAGNFLPAARRNTELNSFSQQPVSQDIVRSTSNWIKSGNQILFFSS